MSAHTCPLPGCHAGKADYQVMCRSHWLTVSKKTRLRVWNGFRNHPGSPEHIEAIRESIQEAMEEEA